MGFQRKSRPLHAPELTADEALLKMEQFCAYRDRCEQEVKQKMTELRLPAALADELLEALKEDRFFDEVRFSEAFVRGKFRSNQWGKVRIRMELKMRQVDPAIIEKALEEIDAKEYRALAHRLLQKKIQQWEGDPQGRQKAAGAVIRSGFESDLVFKLLNLKETFEVDE